jgi:HPt (histidine-containing phosphotransfer) domain-containing protein
MEPTMTEPINTDIAQKTAWMIAWLWERSQPQVEERLRLLERAAAANRQGEMEDEQRTAAQDIAHKLAGSLGMFGFLLASKIASELEQLFESGNPDPGLLVELTGQLRGSLERREQGIGSRE